MDSIKSLILIVCGILENILSFVFFYLLLLFFNIETIGVYSILISFFMIFSFITDLGFTLAHLNLLTEAKNHIEEQYYNGTILYFRLIQYSLYILIILILIIFIPLYKEDILAVYWLFFANLLMISDSLFRPLLLSKKYVLKKSIAILFAFILRILLMMILINFFIANIWLIIYILFVSNLSYFIFNLFFLRNFKFRKPTAELKKKYFKYAFPLFINFTLTVIMNHIDILIINLWFPLKVVANFFVAKNIYLILFGIEISIIGVLLPTFAKNVNSGNNANNYKLVQTTHKFLSFFIVPLVFLIILFANDILIFFIGENYKITASILMILCLNLLIMSVSYANIIFLMSLKRNNFILTIVIFREFIRFFLLIIFISPFFLNMGVIGAALAIFLSYLATEIFFRPMLYIKFNLGFYWGFFRNLAIMWGIFLLQFYINLILNYPTYLIPLFVIFDFGLYIIFNFFFKGISREEIKFLTNFLRFKNIKQLIISEID